MIAAIDPPRPGVPRGYPDAFDSAAVYMDRIVETRSHLRESEAAGLNHFVYVIAETRQPEKGPLKIGYTTRPKKRLLEMQVCCPYELEILLMSRCPHQHFDRAIHALLPPTDRRRGEWYRPSPWVVWVLEVLFFDELPVLVPRELERHLKRAGIDPEISLGR